VARQHRQSEKGFTLIEMLVVAPIVVLAIGAFLTVIISMTGEVITSRASNTLTYNIQDALNRIEQDVKLSAGFLAETDTNLTGAGGNTLQAGQGVGDTNAPFRNISGNATALILNMIATNENPLSADSGYVYLRDQPDPCTSPQANIPLTYNVVYFIEDNTLWRRVIMPQNYDNTTTTVCAPPWQQPSCNPDYLISPGSAFCTAADARLVDDVTSFTTQYLNGASGDTPIAAALIEGANTPSAIEARNIAIQAATTLSVSISSTQSAAGREVSQASSLRVSRLDINASSLATIPDSTTPASPAVTGTSATGAQAVFTWPSVNGATGYTFEYNIDGGSWTTGFTNQNTRTFTVSAPYNGAAVNARVSAINSAGTSSQALQTVTIPVWEPLILQNNWFTYSTSFATAGYSKTSDGIIVLKGMIKRTGAYTVGETIATLPPGYRPTGQLMFGGMSYDLSSRIDVKPDGDIAFNSGHNITWSSLDSVRFVASGAHTITNVPTLLNGWSNWGNGWQTASHMQDSNSRVWVQGLLNAGTSSINTQIFAMPSGRISTEDLHIPTRGTVFRGIGVNSNGVVTKGASTTSFHSVTSMYYPAGAATWTNMSSLGGGWVAYGGGFATPAYTKGTDNLVTLKGLIRSGSTSSGTVIFTLPVGFRPSEQLLIVTFSNNSTGRIDINTNGQIIFRNGSNAWLSLSGLSFLVE
jgi:type II secretory pathway pseudopilin PulG